MHWYISNLDLGFFPFWVSKPALKYWSFFSPKFNQNRTEVPKNWQCAIFERRCSKCDQFFFKLNCQQIILLSVSRSKLLLAKSARFRKNAVINCNPPTSGLQPHSVLKNIEIIPDWKFRHQTNQPTRPNSNQFFILKVNMTQLELILDIEGPIISDPQNGSFGSSKWNFGSNTIRLIRFGQIQADPNWFWTSGSNLNQNKTKKLLP